MTIKSKILSLVVIAIATLGITATANAYYIGQTGSEVVEIQITLLEAGFDIPAISSGVARPGYFGVQTQKALASYEASQSSSKLKFGAVSTLDGVDFPFITINGYQEWRGNIPFAATSSTLCSVRNPFQATSSLTAFGARATSVGGLATQLFDLATSTTAYATSTPAYLKEFSSPASDWSVRWEPGTTTGSRLIGHSNNSQGNSDNLIGPNEYLNFRISTSSASAFSSYMTGACNFIIQRN